MFIFCVYLDGDRTNTNSIAYKNYQEGIAYEKSLLDKDSTSYIEGHKDGLQAEANSDDKSSKQWSDAYNQGHRDEANSTTDTGSKLYQAGESAGEKSQSNADQADDKAHDKDSVYDKAWQAGYAAGSGAQMTADAANTAMYDKWSANDPTDFMKFELENDPSSLNDVPMDVSANVNTKSLNSSSGGTLTAHQEEGGQQVSHSLSGSPSESHEDMINTGSDDGKYVTKYKVVDGPDSLGHISSHTSFSGVVGGIKLEEPAVPVTGLNSHHNSPSGGHVGIGDAGHGHSMHGDVADPHFEHEEEECHHF